MKVIHKPVPSTKGSQGGRTISLEGGGDSWTIGTAVRAKVMGLREKKR